ncbi:hypothetical protein [Clostridium sporogenes]|uniref:hypothetical protein n=1 Tax=Clostridium sporogenes TaxID=1509 RepID=UPI000AB98120|nr:hypothetical protein [Clostridium sporogenes]
MEKVNERLLHQNTGETNEKIRKNMVKMYVIMIILSYQKLMNLLKTLQRIIIRI